jgi:hypothetical protein
MRRRGCSRDIHGTFPCSLGRGRRWHRRGSVVLASFLLHCGRLRLRPCRRGIHGAEAAAGRAPPDPANRGAPPPPPRPLLLVRHSPCFASAAAHLFLRRRRGAARRRGRLLVLPPADGSRRGAADSSSYLLAFWDGARGGHGCAGPMPPRLFP